MPYEPIKPAQAQENLIAYYRLFAPLPGMVTVDDAETFWFVGCKRRFT